MSARRENPSPPAEWIVLGSGTAVPSPERAPTAHALRVGAGWTLIDPGPGALHRAACAGLRLEALRCVLLTHHHPDHCLDLAALLFARRNPDLAARTPPLSVIGGVGTRTLIEALDRAFPGWLDVAPGRLTVTEIDGGEFDLDDGTRVRAVPVAHTPASLAYRFERVGGGAGTVAFSGDTEVCPGAIEAARGVDVFVVEAAAPDDAPLRGHLTPSRAARIAAEAGCRRLVLTHFYPPVDVAEAERAAAVLFPGPVTIAADGLRLPLHAGSTEDGGSASC